MPRRARGAARRRATVPRFCVIQWTIGVHGFQVMQNEISRTFVQLSVLAFCVGKQQDVHLQLFRSSFREYCCSWLSSVPARRHARDGRRNVASLVECEVGSAERFFISVCLPP